MMSGSMGMSIPIPSISRNAVARMSGSWDFVGVIGFNGGYIFRFYYSSFFSITGTEAIGVRTFFGFFGFI